MDTDKRVWDWRSHILHDGPKNATYKHLLLTLSCYMDSAGQSCFPSIDTLEKVTSLSRPTIVKYLKQAKNDGWIEVEKHGFGGKGWARNEYKASLPKAVKEVNHEPEGSKPDSRRQLTSQDKAVKEVNSISSYNSSYNSSGSARVYGVLIPKPLQEIEAFKEKYERWWEYLTDQFNKRPNAFSIEEELFQLVQLRADGNNPIEVISQSIRNKNKSLYALRDFDKKESQSSSSVFRMDAVHLDQFVPDSPSQHYKSWEHKHTNGLS